MAAAERCRKREGFMVTVIGGIPGDATVQATEFGRSTTGGCRTAS